MDGLSASLQATIDGKRPSIITVRSYRRSRKTEPAVDHLLGELARVTERLVGRTTPRLVLSIGAAGGLEVAVPAATNELEADELETDELATGRTASGVEVQHHLPVTRTRSSCPDCGCNRGRCLDLHAGDHVGVLLHGEGGVSWPRRSLMTSR